MQLHINALHSGRPELRSMNSKLRFAHGLVKPHFCPSYLAYVTATSPTARLSRPLSESFLTLATMTDEFRVVTGRP